MAVQTFAKTAVAIMTVLIIVLSVAVLWGMSRPPSTKIAETSVNQALAPWSSVLPNGTIRSMTSAGNNLAILLDTPKGSQIYIYSTADSRLIGSFSEAPRSP